MSLRQIRSHKNKSVLPKNMWAVRKVIVALVVTSVYFAAAQAPPFKFGPSTGDVLIGQSADRLNVDLPIPMAYLNATLISKVQQFVDGFIFLLQNVDNLNKLSGIVDVYFMDFSIVDGGDDQNEVWNRVGTNLKDLILARNIIAGSGADFTPKAILVATWNKVEACCNLPDQHNTFQLAMPYSDTGETWAIFAYPQLQFFRSEGFNNDSAEASIEGVNGVERSVAFVDSDAAMNTLSDGTNCNQRGVYAFQITEGTPKITPTKCGLLGLSIFCPSTQPKLMIIGMMCWDGNSTQWNGLPKDNIELCNFLMA